MSYKFEVYRDKEGKYRVRFKAPNGGTLFSTQDYTQKASAKNAIASIKKNAPGAVVADPEALTEEAENGESPPTTIARLSEESFAVDWENEKDAAYDNISFSLDGLRLQA